MNEIPTCPTCGHPLEAADLGDKLLRLLREPGRRQVYRINNSSMWAVTASRDAGHFDGTLIRSLVSRGLLAPVYPGTTAERECYGDASYYGSANYLREMREKIAERDARKGRRGRSAGVGAH